MLLCAFSPARGLRADISGFGSTGTGFSLNSGATVSNGVATLTDGGINQARSIFYSTPQPIAGFRVSFTYRESASLVAAGEGFAFVIQNDSRQAQAVGQRGTLLGYGGGSGVAAISPSAAVEFNLLNVAGVTASNTGYATNGTLTGTLYGLPTSVNIGNGSPVRVDLVYNGSTLTETLTNLTTGVSSSTYSYAAGNLSTLLGSNTAYIGFTGSSGLLPATQTISDFSFVAVPESSLWGMASGGGLLLLCMSRLCLGATTHGKPGRHPAHLPKDAGDSSQETRLVGQQVYKVTYPNGKIYIGQDRADAPLDFAISSRKDLRVSLAREDQRQDFTVRKKILWESETSSAADVSARAAEFIRCYRANDPAVGYNR